MLSTKVPQETKIIAHGYLRGEYNHASKYPIDIVILIAAFINLNDDKWSLKLKGPNIEVNEANASIKYTKKRSAWQTIYGCMTCTKPNIYNWRIKIINIPQNRIFLGVADISLGVNQNKLNKIFKDGIYGVYAVANGGFRCENGTMSGKYDRPIKNLCINASDVVEIILDLDERHLKFEINGVQNEMMTVYNIPDKNEYTLFVGVYNQNLEIKMSASYCG